MPVQDQNLRQPEDESEQKPSPVPVNLPVDPQAHKVQGFIDQVTGMQSPAPGDDSIRPTTSPLDLMAGAAGSRIGSALASDAGTIIGNEAGELSLGPNTWGENNPDASVRLLGKLGVKQPMPPVQAHKFINAALDAGTVTPQEAQQAINALKSANPRQQFADGGVSSVQDSPEAIQEAAASNPPTAQQTPPVAQPEAPTGIPIYDISGQEPVFGHMDPNDVHDAVTSGKFSFPKGSKVPVFSPEGELGDVDSHEAPDALKNGYRYATPDAIENHVYGTAGQQAIAGVEGLAQGVAGPLATGAERLLGVPAQDIASRAKVNPFTHGASEVTGLVGGALTGTGEAAVLEHAGELAAKVFGPKGVSTLAKIGARGVSDATQMALYQSGDEVSKLLENDPSQSLGSATANIGLSALLGGVAGGAFGSVSPLWNATVGDKAAKVIEDFKGRLNFLKGNPDLESGLVKELGEHYAGLKAASNELDEQIGKMESPSFIRPEYAKSVRQKLEGHLEDLAPALKDFENKFTSKIDGIPTIDSAKVSDYLRDTGGAGKKEVLQNFIKSGEEYKIKLNQLHSELGNETKLPPASLPISQSTLDKLPPGARLADYFVKRGVNHLAGEALGSSVGAALGHLVGAPGIGALIGERALGPIFKSVLPGIVKPLIEQVSNSAGAKAALDYGVAIAKGEAAINKASKALFKGTGEVASAGAIKDSDRSKLDSQLQRLQQDPTPLTKVSGDIGHYLPAHATAIAATSANAVNYLNSLRPKPSGSLPLDSKLPPDPMKQAAYHSALDIANNPLLVVHKMSKGTLTPGDVQTLHTINPGAYQRVSKQLMSEMMEHVSKGGTVPYKTRIQLSMFLGQPLDSTLTPQGILLAQPTPNQPQPGTPQTPPSRPKNSTAKLGNAAKGAMTASQSRESRSRES